MKLDSRIIIPHTEILTCFDTDSENARKAVGKKGYFSFRLGSFYDLSTCDYGTLDLIDTANRDDDHGSDDVFHRKENNCYYSYFISEEFIALKEKKYRPYTFMEFTDKFTVGQPIKFREKDEPDIIMCYVMMGYKQRENRYNYVFLGGCAYTHDELFNGYEWYDDNVGQWKPFGIEE